MHQKMYEAKKQMFGPISFGASTGSNVIRHFLMTVNELCIMYVCMYSGATIINVLKLIQFAVRFLIQNVSVNK